MIIQRDTFIYLQVHGHQGSALVCFELGACVRDGMFDALSLYGPYLLQRREHRYHKLDLRTEKERENSNLAVSC